MTSPALTYLAQRLATYRRLYNGHATEGSPEHREAVADLLTALPRGPRPASLEAIVSEVQSWSAGQGPLSAGLARRAGAAYQEAREALAGHPTVESWEAVSVLANAAADATAAAVCVAPLWGITESILHDRTPWAEAVRGLVGEAWL